MLNPVNKNLNLIHKITSYKKVTKINQLEGKKFKFKFKFKFNCVYFMGAPWYSGYHHPLAFQGSAVQIPPPASENFNFIFSVWSSLACFPRFNFQLYDHEDVSPILKERTKTPFKKKKREDI